MGALLSWLQAFASSNESTTMPSADFCPITQCITARGADTKGGRKAEQSSPGKNMNLPYTIAAFTIPLNPNGLRNVVLARPEVQPYMLFLSVDS